MKHRTQMLNIKIFKYLERSAAYIGLAQPEHDAHGQWSHHKAPAVLRPTREVFIEMHRMLIHRHQAEEGIIEFSNGTARLMPKAVSRFQVVKGSPVAHAPTIMPDSQVPELRTARRTDVPFLWKMLYASIFRPAGAAPLDPSILQHPRIACYLTGWGRRGDAGIVATVGRNRVGAAWFRLYTAEEPGYGFVDESTPELVVAVIEGYRGIGIGTKLLERLITLGRSMYPALSLSVDPLNAAIHLYGRLGFKPAGRERTMILRFSESSNTQCS
jgi:ribosomal protein S18 acetylase RimI-like enzyme